MKKNLLTLSTILFFILFSCSDELDIPPSGEMILENFGIADARCYFEENATDLSFMHFSDSVPTTRSASQSHAELSPDWSKAVRSVSQEVSLIEVPLNSNAFMLSKIRCFEAGKSAISKSYFSNIRLVVARRKNGKSEMFVMTLVPSIKYAYSQKSIENFRYMGGGDFTGKVFCSTLDGRFVEASQYVNGQFVGILRVTTRRQLAQRNIQLDDESYESIVFASGIKTRSGTYVFDESGVTGGKCEWHPQYEASECPYCLSEVIVRNCPSCHRRLEEGEVCHCKCSWCQHYPCSCASTCSTCRPDPCTKCPNCQRHYCFGGCESTGGGGGGGSGEVTPPPVIPDLETPIADALYASVSTFTPKQKIRLNMALRDFTERSTEFKKMYDRLVEIRVKIKFEINPGRLDKVEGKAGYMDNTMMFYGEDYITLNYLLEEMIHAVQAHDIYGQSYMEAARKNVEFEAKIIQDIVSAEVGGASIGGMGQTEEFKLNYEDWIWGYQTAGKNQFISRFHEFCVPWTSYSGTYKPDFYPGTINKYFK